MKIIKKLFFIAFFSFTLSACVDYNQKSIDLGISLKNIPSNFGNFKKVQVRVFDVRNNKPNIGTKKVGDILVTINSNQDLIKLIGDRISEGLERKGFAKGDDKIMEIYITSFEYEARRRFFTGNSKMSVLFKITVKDKYDDNKKYQKSYGLTVEKDHFIMPLITTDEDTINAALQETIYDIFQDNALIENLKS